MQQVAYDERGLVPCVVQDWSSGEVLTLAYMNEQALRAHARDRRAAPVEPLARGAVAQGRNQRQHPDGAGAAPGLRRRHAARARRAGRARPVTRASAPAFTAASSSPRAPHETLPALERTLARPRARAPAGLLHGRAARRPRADRREGDGGGRGGRARRARGVRRARRRRGGRRALPPARAAAQPRALARRRRAGARWPSLAERRPGADGGAATASRRVEPSLEQARALAREHNLIPLRDSFIDDCETPVSAFLKLRALAPGEPAFLLESAEQGQRVGRWSFIGFRPRACCAGRSATAATPTRSPAEHVAPLRAGADGRRAAVHRRRRRLLRLRPRAHGRAARRARRPIRSGCPTWR